MSLLVFTEVSKLIIEEEVIKCCFHGGKSIKRKHNFIVIFLESCRGENCITGTSHITAALRVKMIISSILFGMSWLLDWM